MPAPHRAAALALLPALLAVAAGGAMPTTDCCACTESTAADTVGAGECLAHCGFVILRQAFDRKALTKYEAKWTAWYLGRAGKGKGTGKSKKSKKGKKGAGKELPRSHYLSYNDDGMLRGSRMHLIPPAHIPSEHLVYVVRCLPACGAVCVRARGVRVCVQVCARVCRRVNPSMCSRGQAYEIAALNRAVPHCCRFPRARASPRAGTTKRSSRCTSRHSGRWGSRAPCTGLCRRTQPLLASAHRAASPWRPACAAHPPTCVSIRWTLARFSACWGDGCGTPVTS